MADRTKKRRLARRRRHLRWMMVHAAGCVLRDCACVQLCFDIYDVVPDAIELGVRIPRSLRRHWGLEAKP